MKKNYNHYNPFLGYVYGVVVLLILFGLVIGIAKTCNTIHDNILWNDGVCKCGGNWVYEQAVGHYHSTSYIYRCNKCGKLIELTKTK